MTITFEINMASLALGRHVRLFVVDDVLSKLKGFSFNKGKVKELCERSKTCAKRLVRKVFCAKCPVF